MSKTLTFRISDEMDKSLTSVSKEIDRDKTFIIKKAIEKYLDEYIDYQIALDRLRNKDDEIISINEMESSLEN